MDKNSSTYALRSKFKVSLERFGLAQNYFDNAMDNAMVMSSSTLQNVLWNMSFNESREEALNSLRLTTEVEKEDASFKFIPLELVTLLRNELRFQFSVNINREFMKENDEQLTSYKKFVKSFGTDAIITYCIYQFVKVFLQVNYGVNNGLIEKNHLAPEIFQGELQVWGIKEPEFKTARSFGFDGKISSNWDIPE